MDENRHDAADLMSRLLAIALFSLLCGCGAHLPVVPHADGDVSIRIVEGGAHTERVLKAGSVEARRLARWLDENAGGWHGYYATPPSDGIFISTRLGYLQFSRTGVIAMCKNGLCGKKVSEDFYALLRGDNGICREVWYESRICSHIRP